MVKEGNLEHQEEEGTTEQKYESKQLIIFLTSYINHIWLLKYKIFIIEYKIQQYKYKKYINIKLYKYKSYNNIEYSKQWYLKVGNIKGPNWKWGFYTSFEVVNVDTST